ILHQIDPGRFLLQNKMIARETQIEAIGLKNRMQRRFSVSLNENFLVFPLVQKGSDILFNPDLPALAADMNRQFQIFKSCRLEKAIACFQHESPFTSNPLWSGLLR